MRRSVVVGWCRWLVVIGWVVASGPAIAQPQPPPAETRFQPRHPLSPLANRTRSTSTIDNDRAREVVATILKQYGLALDPDAWDIAVTDDQGANPYAIADVKNRVAADGTVKSVRTIEFNRSFIEQIVRQNDDNWTLYAIAAHEMAHQLGNHVVRRNLSTPLAEREADYHAGFVVGRMGAPYRKATDVLRWLPGQDDTSVPPERRYPTRAQRLCEIGRGWRDARALEAIAGDMSNAARPEFCEDKAPDPAIFRTRINRDINGHDIKFAGLPYIPGIDIAACAQRCKDIPECKAFSFDRWGGYCYLKDAISESYGEPTSTIGVKRPAELPNASRTAPSQTIPLSNRRFSERGAAPPTPAENRDACRAQCEASRSCVAYTFAKVEKLCVQFKQSVGHFVDARYDSGYKRQVPPAATPKQ